MDRVGFPVPRTRQYVYLEVEHGQRCRAGTNSFFFTDPATGGRPGSKDLGV